MRRRRHGPAAPAAHRPVSQHEILHDQGLVAARGGDGEGDALGARGVVVDLVPVDGPVRALSAAPARETRRTRRHGAFRTWSSWKAEYRLGWSVYTNLAETVTLATMSDLDLYRSSWY